jgi:hypothetical protein
LIQDLINNVPTGVNLNITKEAAEGKPLLFMFTRNTRLVSVEKTTEFLKAVVL